MEVTTHEYERTKENQVQAGVRWDRWLGIKSSACTCSAGNDFYVGTLCRQ